MGDCVGSLNGLVVCSEAGGLSLGEGVDEGHVFGPERQVDVARDRGYAGSERDVGRQTAHR
jgi:hypothetical protein